MSVSSTYTHRNSTAGKSSTTNRSVVKRTPFFNPKDNFFQPRHFRIQPKLNVNAPDDKYEQEANRVANAIIRMPDPLVLHQPMEEEEEDFQNNPLNGNLAPFFQRKETDEESPSSINEFGWDNNSFIGPLSEKQKSNLKDDARDLHLFVTSAWIDADTKGNSWTRAAKQFGKCYKTAFERHERVRKKQERAEKLAADIAFGVLTIVGGGALGSLATVAESAQFFHNMPSWKTTGILEIMKGTGSKIIEGVAKPEQKSYDVPKDPLTFWVELEKAVASHIEQSTLFLNRLVQRFDKYVAGELPLHDLYYIDPLQIRKKINAWKKTQHIFRNPPAVPENELTKELEIGIWAKWIPQLQYERYFIIESWDWEDQDQPGRYVVSRLKELGIPVQTYTKLVPASGGAEMRAVSRVKLDHLVNWAKTWEGRATRFNLS